MATPASQADGLDIPCPYVDGATFSLEITTPGGSVSQAQARVIKVFEPLNASAVMRVALESVVSPTGATSAHDDLPTDVVLRVYDHRFALTARRDFGLEPLTPEREAEYTAYANTPKAPHNLEELAGKGDNCPSPDDPEFQIPDHLVLEHIVAPLIASYFPRECSAYERLSSLQGNDIPVFYGTVRFLGSDGAPHPYLAKPGVLIQHIEGTNLESIKPEHADVNFLASECLRIIDTYGSLGVRKRHVLLESFVVKPDGSGVVLIDLGDTEVRGDNETDDEWKEARRMEDEEGELRHWARATWGKAFDPSSGLPVIQSGQKESREGYTKKAPWESGTGHAAGEQVRVV